MAVLFYGKPKVFQIRKSSSIAFNESTTSIHMGISRKIYTFDYQKSILSPAT